MSVGLVGLGYFVHVGLGNVVFWACCLGLLAGGLSTAMRWWCAAVAVFGKLVRGSCVFGAASRSCFWSVWNLLIEAGIEWQQTLREVFVPGQRYSDAWQCSWQDCFAEAVPQCIHFWC